MSKQATIYPVRPDKPQMELDTGDTPVLELILSTVHACTAWACSSCYMDAE